MPCLTYCVTPISTASNLRDYDVSDLQSVYVSFWHTDEVPDCDFIPNIDYYTLNSHSVFTCCSDGNFMPNILDYQPCVSPLFDMVMSGSDTLNHCLYRGVQYEGELSSLHLTFWMYLFVAWFGGYTQNLMAMSLLLMISTFIVGEAWDPVTFPTLRCLGGACLYVAVCLCKDLPTGYMLLYLI